MKKTVFLLSMLAMAVNLRAQSPVGGFGLGGQQVAAEQNYYSQKFADLNYADDDQTYHTLDIYLPKLKARRYPVVIHIYGSAWFNNNGKNAADLGTICAALLRAGYAVVTPNHRSSGDAKFPAQLHDIKAVVRFLRGNARRYHLDPSFIATSGFSSGGHLASLTATTSGTTEATVGKEHVDLEGSLGQYTSFSSEVNACIDWSGPIDLITIKQGDGIKMKPVPEDVLLDATVESNRDRFVSLSPITYLDPSDPPVAIFHGTADNVVPFSQGEEFAQALKDKGTVMEFTPVPGGGHGFNMYSPDILDRMVRFLDAARKDGKKARK